MLDHGDVRGTILNQPQSGAGENTERGKTVHLSFIPYLDASDLDLAVEGERLDRPSMPRL